MASSSPKLSRLVASVVAAHEGRELLAFFADLHDLGSSSADEEGLGLLVEVKRAHLGQDRRRLRERQVNYLLLLHLVIPDNHLTVSCARYDSGIVLDAADLPYLSAVCWLDFYEV